MNGRIVGISLVVAGAVAGIAMYYLQVHAFYEDVTADIEDIQLTTLAGGRPEPILSENVNAIDAASSPLRFRACFETPMSQPMLTETYVLYDEAVPLNAPEWFDCFDAEAIAGEINAGTALTFLGQKNIHFGVDRIVAVTEDGRGFIWHELNDCGQKAYDGTIVGEECPKRETN